MAQVCWTKKQMKYYSKLLYIPPNSGVQIAFNSADILLDRSDKYFQKKLYWPCAHAFNTLISLDNIFFYKSTGYLKGHNLQCRDAILMDLFIKMTLTQTL